MTDAAMKEREGRSASAIGMEMRRAIADMVPDKASYRVWATPGVIEYMNRRIAQAIAEEREACARIAERDVDWTKFKRQSKKNWKTGDEQNIYAEPVEPDDTMSTDFNVFSYRIGIATGSVIAAAIRGQT